MVNQAVLSKKPNNFWRSLLMGLPNSRSVLLSFVTFSINLALILGVTDYIFRARFFHSAQDLSFARMGYISPMEANLLVREPNASLLPISVYYRIITSQAVHEDIAWQVAGIITSLENKTDYTGVVTFKLPSDLEHTYQWTTSNNHSGFFTTPPKAGNLTRNGDFTFLTSSCIKVGFPYNPLNHALTIPGFKHMFEALKKISRVQFMLFLGDFIYIDVPKRFGTSVEDYRREYRQVYASPDWPLVGQNLSWIHVLDDHEIANDWDRQLTGIYNAAVDPWHHYQTAVNPPKAEKPDKNDNKTYFEFTSGPASFFMLDTRTYRHPKRLPANATEKTMLGSSQLSSLISFLRKPETDGVHWKFVISSVPFTKNWRVNRLDTWAGFLHERQVILEAMWDVGFQSNTSVVVLSGDRHEFAATDFPPPIGGKWPSNATVHEFSVSPMNQFYSPIRSYRQSDDGDVEVQYIPSGNSKFGAITIKKVSSGHQSMLSYRLIVDGKEVWSKNLLSPSLVSDDM